MKTEIISVEKPSQDRRYPYLGLFKRSGLVVLFIGRNRGFAVHGDEHTMVGAGETWDESVFDYFTDKVLMSNS